MSKRNKLALVSAAFLYSGSCFAEVVKIPMSLNLEGKKFSGFVYKPSVESSQAIFLQHGFARSAKNMDDLALELAERGSYVVAMTLGFGQHQNIAIAKSVANFLATSRKISDTVTIPKSIVLMGHSAGGLFVSRVGKFMEQDFKQVPKGYVMLDGVDAAGSIVELFKSQSKVPRLAIAAEPSSCNSKTKLSSDLKSLAPAFVGIKINGSTHCSAEGNTTDGLCTLVCGTSPVAISDDWKSIAGSWSQLMFDAKDLKSFEASVQQGIANKIYTRL